jgi:hypothetical protein
VKCYGKLAESGDTAATGVLRVEIEARRLSTFRAYLDRKRGEPVQLLEVLTPQVREAVMNRFADVFERCILTENELTARRFVDEFIEFFPGTRGLTLMGFCLAYRLAGFPSAKNISRGSNVFPFSRASVYRYLSDLRRFRHYLVKQGYSHPVTMAENNRHEEGLDELSEDFRMVRYIGQVAEGKVA